MKKILYTTLTIMIAVTIIGCQPATRNIDTVNDIGSPLMGLDYRDFARAASDMIQSMSRSSALRKPDGGRYVMATSNIKNDTMLRIDTDQLMAKIQEDLLNSGRVVFTSSIGSGDSVEEMILKARKLRSDPEYNVQTVQEEGRLIAPDLSISGKILQKNMDYNKNTQQVEYYFQLRITDLETGLVIWQRETVIGKRGSDKSVPW